MENTSNHSFYVVIFQVFCKRNLIAHHRLFSSDYISYLGQLLTFPVCLKETLTFVQVTRSKVFL